MMGGKKHKGEKSIADIRKAMYTTITNGLCYDALGLIAAEHGFKVSSSSSFYYS